MMTRVHIDCFTALDDIPLKMQGAELERVVLAALRVTKRFSTFEGERFGDLIKQLERRRLVKTDTNSLSYPWIAVEVFDDK